MLLQSWITVDQSAAQITKDFDAWFKKNGRSLLASAKTSDQELDDEDAGYNEELDEEGDAAPPLGEPDSAELLDAVSDHLKQILEIHNLAEEINAGTPAPVATDAAELAEEVSAGTAAPVAADATDALVPVADTGSEVTAASAKPIAGDDAESQQGQLVLEQGEHAEDPEPAPNTFHALIVACKKNELFDMDTERAKTNVGCRDRQLFLMPLIRRFTAAVRLREQHLSKATILRDREHTMSEYHALHHELEPGMPSSATGHARVGRGAGSSPSWHASRQWRVLRPRDPSGTCGRWSGCEVARATLPSWSYSGPTIRRRACMSRSWHG